MSGRMEDKAVWTDLEGNYSYETTQPNDMYGNYSMYDYGMMDMPYSEIFEVINFINRYIKPSVICFGIVSNVFMFILILNSKLRKFAPMIYMVGLALADSGYLFFNGLLWMQFFFQLNIYHVMGMCQLVNYCIKAFTFLSRWYMAAFAMERLIWEFFPERRSELCNVFKTRLVLVSISVLALYGHVYFCWFLEVSEETKMCGVPQEYRITFNRLLQIDLVFSYMIPYGLIITTSVIVAIRKIRCKRRSEGSEPLPERPVRQRGRLQIVDNREDRARHLHATGILLCFCVSMIVLTVPIHTADLIGIMFSKYIIHLSLTDIFTACIYTYCATKPLICFVVSPKVRHCAKKLLKRAVSRATNRKMARPNSNSITLQEFNNEDSVGGTLIAVV